MAEVEGAAPAARGHASPDAAGVEAVVPPAAAARTSPLDVDSGGSGGDSTASTGSSSGGGGSVLTGALTGAFAYAYAASTLFFAAGSDDAASDATGGAAAAAAADVLRAEVESLRAAIEGVERTLVALRPLLAAAAATAATFALEAEEAAEGRGAARSQLLAAAEQNERVRLARMRSLFADMDRSSGDRDCDRSTTSDASELGSSRSNSSRSGD